MRSSLPRDGRLCPRSSGPNCRSACPGSAVQARPGTWATLRLPRARGDLDERDHVALRIEAGHTSPPPSPARSRPRVITAAHAKQHRTLAATDGVAPQSGDAGAVPGFYLGLGCILAGYLLAASLSNARPARDIPRRTLWRFGSTVPYAGVVGLGAALIADPLLRAITGHFAALWGIGTLLVLAAATIAFQSILGFLWIAATIAALAVLGSPSVDGAHPYQMRPGFWRTIGTWLPNGAGVDAVRRLVYLAATASRLGSSSSRSGPPPALSSPPSPRTVNADLLRSTDRPHRSLQRPAAAVRPRGSSMLRAGRRPRSWRCVASNDRHFGGTRSSATC
jgi:hypothetical protein